MARTGMATLITELRRRTLAGTADSTINGTVYWSDNQLQDVLDRYRCTNRDTELSAIPQRSGAGFVYLEYPIPPQYQWIEQSATDSGWQLRDSAGGTSLSYTVNYSARMVTFNADTANTDYYLDCRTYDLNMAAADVWESKASFIHENVNWSSDNHRIEASKEYENCLQQAKYWRAKGGMQVAKMWRSDER